MTGYYVGLISGTSMDGIDAALVSFDSSSVNVINTLEHPYPDELRLKLLHLARNPELNTVDNIGELDQWVGECFRDATKLLLTESGTKASDVLAIGSHGQTVRHRPDAARPFTMQIGDPTIIAAGTGITTVADFRRADVARGGQGAPLTPPLHEWLFRQSGTHRVVLNIGGISNITVLDGDATDVIGFDTGPGNTLLDAWIGKHKGDSFDHDGTWAGSGKVDLDLLSRLLADPYFQKAPPKSTGFEYFNLNWLAAANTEKLAAVDVQATLNQLTATSIANAIRTFAPRTSEVFVCGGGVHNHALMRTLAANLPEARVESTSAVGLDPDWVEAAAFAWLAMRTLQGLPGNLPAVTGASKSAVLGAIYPA